MEGVKITNQNSLFRSRDWLSANQGPVFPNPVDFCYTKDNPSLSHSLYLTLSNVPSSIGYCRRQHNTYLFTRSLCLILVTKGIAKVRHVLACPQCRGNCVTKSHHGNNT
eukprot:sb/3477367/